jgi:transposase
MWKKKLLEKMSPQQKPISNDEKLIIIKSYAEGIPPSVISKQIGKTVGSITKFYSRWKLDKNLPPKEKQNRSLIDGRMGMMIKNQVSETPKLSLKKLAAKIKERVSEGV